LSRLRLTFAALLGLVLCAFAAAPSTEATRLPLMLGLQDDALLTSGESSAWPLAKTLGVGVVRFNVAWNNIARRRPKHPGNPADPAYNWSQADLMAERTRAMGAEPLFTIVGAPRWANGGHGPAWAPQNMNALTSFCRAVATRYRGDYVDPETGETLPEVDRYTVWNEPNRGQYLQPQGKGGLAAAGAEAWMMSTCAPMIGLVNPSSQVALGPLASRGGQGGLAPIPFLQAYLRAGGTTPDVVALNPYLNGLLPVYRPNERRGGIVTLRNLDQLERRLRALAHHTVPVWLTEFAWRVGQTPTGYVSPQRQAALTLQSIALVRDHYPYVDTFIWFLLRDQAPFSYWQSGLVGYDWRRRPAFSAWTTHHPAPVTPPVPPPTDPVSPTPPVTAPPGSP
jgi:hypothetical protein